jgi:hypothetical protein
MLTEKTPQRIKCEGRVVGSVAVQLLFGGYPLGDTTS